MKTELFKKTEKLIYQRAWYYARKYGMDFEDIRSQAFLIFTEAVDRFDPSQGSFVTFLYHRLRTLNDYCKREKRIGIRFTDFENVIDEHHIDENEQSRAWMNERIESLSDDAKIVISGILSGQFHTPLKPYQQKPVSKDAVSYSMVKEEGWTYTRFNRVWIEIRNWYQFNFSAGIA